MAKEQKDTAETQVKTETPVKTVAKPVESTYKVTELANNAKKLFNTRPECVTAALKAANKETSTVKEAKSIVEAFLKKEVK